MGERERGRLYPIKAIGSEMEPFIIKRKSLYIGSGDRCGIRLYTDGVFPEHCILTTGQTGKVYVEPLHQTALVLVNHVKITKKFQLKNNDIIIILMKRFRFAYPADSAYSEVIVKTPTLPALRTKRSAAGMSDEKKTLKKSRKSSLSGRKVRFGPRLTPEEFDKHLPPSSPLRRGSLPGKICLPKKEIQVLKQRFRLSSQIDPNSINGNKTSPEEKGSLDLIKRLRGSPLVNKSLNISNESSTTFTVCAEVHSQPKEKEVSPANKPRKRISSVIKTGDLKPISKISKEVEDLSKIFEASSSDESFECTQKESSDLLQKVQKPLFSEVLRKLTGGVFTASADQVSPVNKARSLQPDICTKKVTSKYQKTQEKSSERLVHPQILAVGSTGHANSPDTIILRKHKTSLQVGNSFKINVRRSPRTPRRAKNTVERETSKNLDILLSQPTTVEHVEKENIENVIVTPPQKNRKTEELLPAEGESSKEGQELKSDAGEGDIIQEDFEKSDLKVTPIVPKKTRNSLEGSIKKSETTHDDSCESSESFKEVQELKSDADEFNNIQEDVEKLDMKVSPIQPKMTRNSRAESIRKSETKHNFCESSELSKEDQELKSGTGEFDDIQKNIEKSDLKVSPVQLKKTINSLTESIGKSELTPDNLCESNESSKEDQELISDAGEFDNIQDNFEKLDLKVTPAEPKKTRSSRIEIRKSETTHDDLRDLKTSKSSEEDQEVKSDAGVFDIEKSEFKVTPIQPKKTRNSRTGSIKRSETTHADLCKSSESSMEDQELMSDAGEFHNIQDDFEKSDLKVTLAEPKKTRSSRTEIRKSETTHDDLRDLKTSKSSKEDKELKSVVGVFDNQEDMEISDLKGTPVKPKQTRNSLTRSVKKLYSTHANLCDSSVSPMGHQELKSDSGVFDNIAEDIEKSDLKVSPIQPKMTSNSRIETIRKSETTRDDLCDLNTNESSKEYQQLKSDAGECENIQDDFGISNLKVAPIEQKKARNSPTGSIRKSEITNHDLCDLKTSESSKEDQELKSDAGAFDNIQEYIENSELKATPIQPTKTRNSRAEIIRKSETTCANLCELNRSELSKEDQELKSNTGEFVNIQEDIEKLHLKKSPIQHRNARDSRTESIRKSEPTHDDLCESSEMTPNSNVLLQKQNTTSVEQVDDRECLENPASLLNKGDGSGKKMDSNSHCTTSDEQENEEDAEGPKKAVRKGRKRKQNVEENEFKKLKKNLVSKDNGSGKTLDSNSQHTTSDQKEDEGGTEESNKGVRTGRKRKQDLIEKKVQELQKSSISKVDGSKKATDLNSLHTTYNEKENEESAEEPKKAVRKGRKPKQDVKENEIKNSSISKDDGSGKTLDSNSQCGNVEECENSVVKVRRGRKRKQDMEENIVEELEQSSVSKDDDTKKKTDSNVQFKTSNLKENKDGIEEPKKAVKRGRKKKQDVKENEVEKSTISKGCAAEEELKTTSHELSPCRRVTRAMAKKCPQK